MVAVALAVVSVAPSFGAAPNQPGPRVLAPQVAPPPALPRPAPPLIEPRLQAPPGATSLVSQSTSDGFANAASTAPSISENGRFVAFPSLANNLVPNDTNNAQDVFVRDRSEGSTIRLPIPDGVFVPTGGAALEPSISADGSAVAFTLRSPPSTLTVPNPCGVSRVVLWRRETGSTSTVSLDFDGEFACAATSPSVSGDGRFVAYVSLLSSAAGVPLTQVFVRDTSAGTTTLVSAANNGATATSFSRAPAISQDGRFVAFESDASNLSSGDTNETTDIFVRTLPNGPTELVSIAPGASGNGASNAPAISADGSVVAFESGARTSSRASCPVRGLCTSGIARPARQRLPSVSTAGASANGASGQSSISADGRIIAFASVAQGLALGNAVLAAVAPAQPTEAYAHDRVSGETIRISEATTGGAAGGFNVDPSVGANGRLVAFASNSPNLVQGDGNQVADVFLRDLPPVPAISPDPIDFGARALGAEGPPLAATVTNTGWSPLSVGGVTTIGDAAADFTIALNGCEGRALRLGESCSVTITFAPSAAGERVASLAVDHNAGRSPATTTLHGSASSAGVQIEPPVGRPGIVVIVTGSGFPANQQIALTWSRGLTPVMPPVITDARGSFRAQVLVFHNDFIGPRDLVVSPVGRASFPPFGSAFLVVEPQSAPPRFEPGDPPRTAPDPHLPLISMSDTIICGRCGVANPAGDQFCGACGAFLEWQAAEAPPADVSPADVPTEAGAPLNMPAPPVGSPGEPQADPGPATQPLVPSPASTAAAAAPPIGFTVCPTCGSGNPPGRTFCHSCGNLLAKESSTAQAGVEAKAGERTSRSMPGWLPIAIGGGLLVGIAIIVVAVVLRPSAPPSVAIPSATLTPTLDVPASVTPAPTLLASGAAPSGVVPGASGEGVQLTASGASASSVASDTPDMAATNVVDGRLDTRWQEAAGSEPGEWIEVTFSASRLDYVVVYSGFQLSHDSFVATRRPQNVAVSMNGGPPVGFLLQDSELPQRIDVADTPGASVVRIQIASTYPAAASAYPGSPIDAATISEIRIFGVAGG